MPVMAGDDLLMDREIADVSASYLLLRTVLVVRW